MFTEKGKAEQKFLKENFPRLFDRYDPYTGYIFISEEEVENNPDIKKDVYDIISVHRDNGDDFVQYVLFKREITDPDGEPIPYYIVYGVEDLE